MSVVADTFARRVKSAVADGYRQAAPGWHKWRREFKIAGTAITQAVLSASDVKAGMRVLDVACGAGEPALSLLPLVGPTGYVVAIDLVAEMLAAPATLLATGSSNIAFNVADGEALPFRDGAFDLVTCRAAVMHFPDPAQALREAYRVLRPNGRAAFSALGPVSDSPAIMTTIAIILRNMQSPPDPAAGLDVYRFSEPGTLSTLFAAAGFREVHEEMLNVPCVWPGNAEHFWQALPDHAWRVNELIESVPPGARQRLTTEIIAALRSYEKDGMLHLTAPIVIATGKR
jgi:ubiquinone/menaquinone biosynthesis C-methylase UbiE